MTDVSNSPAPQASGKRPNIVVLLTDDHAAHSISAYGSVVNTTPRIDEIGARGAQLEHCYVTNSLCAPSRASILTGTYSHVNGVLGLETPFDSSQETFVTRLRDAGYRTALVGKWHLGLGETDGVNHDPAGFDYWDVLIDQGEYWNPEFRSAAGHRHEEGYATDVITDLALDWMGKQPDDQPWCVLIWHKAPHRPWEPHPRHDGLFNDPIPVPDTFDDDYSTRTSSCRRVAMRVADHLQARDFKEDPPAGLSYEAQSLWKYQRYMRDYLRCVAAVDENVGRVIDWLDEKDMFDDTLLAYSSDQGFFLGDHGWFDKRLMFEESLLMPLLVSYPAAIPAGSLIQQTVTNVDFAQTILDAAGVEPAEAMQGRSFFRELTGGAPDGTVTTMYYRYWENDDANHQAPAHYGIRTDRYKLICYYNDGLGIPGTGKRTYAVEWECYDLVNDPEELVNVYNDPRYRDIIAGLTRQLAAEQERVGDRPYPGAMPAWLA